MNKSKDSEFQKIDELKWLPFVGEKYFDSDKKVMIIGESHYQEENEHSIKRNNKVTFTREILSEIAIEKQYWKTKIFQNFNRALFRTDKINTTELWKKLVFYNFVQRPMTNNLHRPSKSDFLNGWKVYFNLIEILKPEFCLFIGVQSSNTIWTAIKNSDLSIKCSKKGEKINGTFPREIILIDSDGNEIKLLFIKHTSQFFSWNNWNKFIKKEYENELNWIKSGIWN